MSNSIDDNLVDDKELNEYLGGDTQYSRRYRTIASDAIPAELDALILGSAAGNVVSIDAAIARKTDSTRRAKSLGFWMRVSVPITLAASFVFAISIMIDGGERPATQAIHADETVIEPAEIAERDKAAEASARLVVESKQRADKREGVGSIAPSSPAPAITERAEERRQELPASPAAQTAFAPPPRASSPPRAAEAPVATDLDQVVVTGQLLRSTPEDAALPVDVITAEDLSQARGNSGAGPRSTIPPASFAKKALSDAELAKEQREADPDAWLDHIRELRAAGKTREADREWQRFVKAYPDFSVGAADTARPKK